MWKHSKRKWEDASFLSPSVSLTQVYLLNLGASRITLYNIHHPSHAYKSKQNIVCKSLKLQWREPEEGVGQNIYTAEYIKLLCLTIQFLETDAKYTYLLIYLYVCGVDFCKCNLHRSCCAFWLLGFLPFHQSNDDTCGQKVSTNCPMHCFISVHVIFCETDTTVEWVRL